jgi:hypothetical protein
MRFFRYRRTLGLLALLAMAMQGVLAFAQTHVHSPAPLRSGVLATRAITYGMCRPDAERPCPAPERKDDHATCPICQAMSLASAAVLQAPPVMPFRHEPVQALTPDRVASLRQGGERVNFRPRAPPRSG